MKHMIGLLIGFCVFVPATLLAQEGETTGNGSSAWENFGFGIGLSFTIDTGSNDWVKSAEVLAGRAQRMRSILYSGNS